MIQFNMIINHITLKKMLRRDLNFPLQAHITAFKELKDQPKENRPFNYFDPSVWLESLQTKQPMKQLVLENYLNNSEKAFEAYMITSKTTTPAPPPEISTR